MSKKNIRNVLMVTGVYYPEVNGATLQCMRVISTLKKDVNFSVLTTTKYKNIAKNNVIDGIDVYRHYIGNRLGKFSQLFGISWIFLTKKIDIVHLHGFSSRSALIVLISKIFNKKVIIKMTSYGHDDVISIANKNRLFFYIFSLANAYIGVSPIFKKMYYHTGMDRNKYYQISNGVDTGLFKPLGDNEDKNKIRSDLGLPSNIQLILIVGHFSIEKSANHVLDALIKLQKEISNKLGVVFIGSTNDHDFEVDKDLVDLMFSKSKEVRGKVFFVESTSNIEKYYQAVDMYVLPSAREGLPNALLEAMSCSLPVLSTRLTGITEWFITHNSNGLMYDYGDIDTLAKLLKLLLKNKNLRDQLGHNARSTIVKNFDISLTTKKIYKVYDEL